MDELLRALPNGLHDAELTAIAVDYGRAEVAASVVIDFSDPDDPRSEGLARDARLVFTGVSLFVVDPPEGAQAHFGRTMIDADTGHPETDPRPDLRAPDGGFLCWIYLFSLNGHIRIGARDVRLEWADPGPPHRRWPA